MLAGLAHARAAALVHLVFVAALVGLLALQVVRGVILAWVVLAAALGAAAAPVPAGEAARVLLSVLGATPVLFLVLFLFFSPVSRLLDSPPQPHLARAPSGAPVVMVVLDELPIVSLGAAALQPTPRYPNSRGWPRTPTWYRNTTTVHEWTTGAVPAILTGERRPADDRSSSTTRTTSSRSWAACTT